MIFDGSISSPENENLLEPAYHLSGIKLTIPKLSVPIDPSIEATLKQFVPAIKEEKFDFAFALLLYLKLRLFSHGNAIGQGALIEKLACCINSKAPTDYPKSFAAELVNCLKTLVLLSMPTFQDSENNHQLLEAEQHVQDVISSFRAIFSYSPNRIVDLFWNNQGLHTMIVLETLLALQKNLIEKLQQSSVEEEEEDNITVNVMNTLLGDVDSANTLLSIGVEDTYKQWKKVHKRRFQAKILIAETFNTIVLTHSSLSAEQTQELLSQVMFIFAKQANRLKKLRDWVVLYAYLEILLNIAFGAFPSPNKQEAVQYMIVKFLDNSLPFPGILKYPVNVTVFNVPTDIAARIEARIVECIILLSRSAHESVRSECAKILMNCRTNTKARFMATPPTPVIAFEINMLHHYVTFVHAGESIWFRSMLIEQEVVSTTQQDILQSLEKRIPEMKSRDMVTFSVSHILEKLLPASSQRIQSIVKENSVYTEKQVWYCFCKYLLLPSVQFSSPIRTTGSPRVAPITPSSTTSKRLSWLDADFEDIVIEEPGKNKKSTSNIDDMFSHLHLDDEKASNAPNSPEDKLALNKGQRFPRKKREKSRQSIYAAAEQMGNIVEYIQRLIDQPEMSLTTEESIFCLRFLLPEKISKPEIDELASLVLVLGATGSGKSTAINWLYGCEMSKLENGQVHVVPSADKIIPTKIGDGSPYPTTLTHQLVTIPSESYLCFCDCPGSLTLSFPEYSIAGLVNILHIIKSLKDTICLYVLAVDTIEDSSTLEKALHELVTRFGGAEGFNRFSDSICIGISFVKYREKKVKPVKTVAEALSVVLEGDNEDEEKDDESDVSETTTDNREERSEEKAKDEVVEEADEEEYTITEPIELLLDMCDRHNYHVYQENIIVLDPLAEESAHLQSTIFNTLSSIPSITSTELCDQFLASYLLSEEVTHLLALSDRILHNCKEHWKKNQLHSIVDNYRLLQMLTMTEQKHVKSVFEELSKCILHWMHDYLEEDIYSLFVSTPDVIARSVILAKKMKSIRIFENIKSTFLYSTAIEKILLEGEGMVKRKELTEQAQINSKLHKQCEQQKQLIERALILLMISEPQYLYQFEAIRLPEIIPLLQEKSEIVKTYLTFMDSLKSEVTKRQTYYYFGDQQPCSSFLQDAEQYLTRIIQHVIQEGRRKERAHLLQTTLQQILACLETIFPNHYELLMHLDLHNLQDQTLVQLGVNTSLLSTIQNIFLQMIYSSPDHVSPEITTTTTTTTSTTMIAADTKTTASLPTTTPEEIKDTENELHLFVEIVRGRATEAYYIHSFQRLQENIQIILNVFPSLVQEYRQTISPFTLNSFHTWPTLHDPVNNIKSMLSVVQSIEELHTKAMQEVTQLISHCEECMSNLVRENITIDAIDNLVENWKTPTALHTSPKPKSENNTLSTTSLLTSPLSPLSTSAVSATHDIVHNEFLQRLREELSVSVSRDEASVQLQIPLTKFHTDSLEYQNALQFLLVSMGMGDVVSVLEDTKKKKESRDQETIAMELKLQSMKEQHSYLSNLFSQALKAFTADESIGVHTDSTETFPPVSTARQMIAILIRKGYMKQEYLDHLNRLEDEMSSLESQYTSIDANFISYMKSTHQAFLYNLDLLSQNFYNMSILKKCLDSASSARKASQGQSAASTSSSSPLPQAQVQQPSQPVQAPVIATISHPTTRTKSPSLAMKTPEKFKFSPRRKSTSTTTTPTTTNTSKEPTTPVMQSPKGRQHSSPMNRSKTPPSTTLTTRSPSLLLPRNTSPIHKHTNHTTKSALPPQPPLLPQPSQPLVLSAAHPRTTSPLHTISPMSKPSPVRVHTSSTTSPTTTTKSSTITSTIMTIPTSSSSPPPPSKHRLSFSAVAPMTPKSPESDRIRLLSDTYYCLQTFPDHTDKVYRVLQLRDGRIASGSGDHTIKLWHPDTALCEQTFTGHLHGIHALIELSDGRLASGSHDHTIKVWNPVTGQCDRTFTGHLHWVNTLLELRETHRIVSGSHDNTIKVWNPSTGECEATLRGHQGWVYFLLELSTGQQLLASCSLDSTIKLWNTVTYTCDRTLVGHTNLINRVIELSDGRLASGSVDQTVHLWNTQTGNCDQTLVGHTAWVYRLVELPGGHRIASCSADSTIKLWSVRTGQCEQTLQGHVGWVDSLIVLKDGRLASGSADRTIKIWNMDTGECELTFSGHEDAIYGLIELQDGCIASCSGDRTIKTWKLY